MKQIVLTPNPVLSQITQPVTHLNKEIKDILQEMKEALLAACDPKGVGLAAPQIGYSLQIFAIKPTVKSPVTFFINPEIVSENQELGKEIKQKTPLEGCLSIPNTWGVVKRKQAITIQYLNIHGKKTIKTFSGFPAIIVQHEMDHLQGILFTARVLEQQGKLYEITEDEEGKENLKELPL